MHKFFVFGVGLAVLLAACGAPNATEVSGTEEVSGWVELEDGLVLDESSFVKVTPVPVAPVTMSRSEAQARLPFEFGVPAWAPEGFSLQDEVEVVQPADGLGYTSVSLTWLNPDEAILRLRVAQAGDDQLTLGAAGSTETLTVNGQPATLVHSQQFGTERLALTWLRTDLTYTLSAEAGAATPAELQRMAESIAPTLRQ